MNLEISKNKYLVDIHGENINIQQPQSFYAILTERRYVDLDLTFKRKVMLSRDNLISHFEPVQNFRKLSYNTDSFGCFYEFWKAKESDLFIKISNSDMESYVEDEDTEDSLKEEAEEYRVEKVFYQPDKLLSETTLLNTICNFNPSTENKIDIIVRTMNGYDFRECEIKPLPIDIDKMYNDDFKPVYEHIVDKLNNGGKGVVLLYGGVGTGKTNVLKNLTKEVNHKFVFVPINMIGYLSDPSFIGDLIKHKSGVLVIEDCENYIEDRATNSNSVVSSLLQITDGMLSDILDIKVICTFNTDLTKVDEALRREGRLIAEYEFKELSDEKAEVLLEGKKLEGKKTLANIFNTLTYKGGEKKETKKIGYV